MAAAGNNGVAVSEGSRDLFNAILEEEKLPAAATADRALPIAFRHTYICLRLAEGANIYQIAKNCRD